MEKYRQSPPEARAASITTYFDDESRKISDKIAKVRSSKIGVDTNGTVRRKEQEILHLEQRQRELDHARSFVLEVLAKTPQTSETPNIGYYFVGKLDEIDLEIERIESHPHGVIIERGRIVRGKKQELEHLRTIRVNMFMVGNFVLDALDQPLLVDEKDSATPFSPTN